MAMKVSLDSKVKHIGMVFSGGPAPAANTVISAVAAACLKRGIKVTGFLYGYRFLENFSRGNKLVKGKHYIDIDLDFIQGLRNSQGVVIHNSRANPGGQIKKFSDLKDPLKNSKLINIFNAFDEMKIDGWVSIGGDDTLKTANYLYRLQNEVKGLRPVKVVHVPKTIDNDYQGIDWTFGFFSAAEHAALNIRNLMADSFTSGSWFIAEIMGRKAGWLTYAAGMIAEAPKMISVEDITEDTLDIDRLAAEISKLVETRKKAGLDFGVVCIAEGVADKLPDEIRLQEIDSHGNAVLTNLEIGKMLCDRLGPVHQKRTGEKVKFIPKQIGYETRCTAPSGYDVIMASQLGVGACHAITEEGLNGVMISLGEQLSLKYVPFKELIDQKTGFTRLKFIEKDSDFWKLARVLEF
jgi:ATP-dependent phosphofructokinase / diphosphate-dependent phosphofructokinase